LGTIQGWDKSEIQITQAISMTLWQGQTNLRLQRLTLWLFYAVHCEVSPRTDKSDKTWAQFADCFHMFSPIFSERLECRHFVQVRSGAQAATKAGRSEFQAARSEDAHFFVSLMLAVSLYDCPAAKSMHTKLCGAKFWPSQEVNNQAPKT
jgi:hypothetical protein